MSNINWKVRFKNKVFWMTIIPQIIALIFQVKDVVVDLMNGIVYNQEQWTTVILAIVTLIFTILGTIGIVVDHTTAGFGDNGAGKDYEVHRDDRLEN